MKLPNSLVAILLLIANILFQKVYGQATDATNTLSGSAPVPVEFLGSDNDFDVIIKANDEERIRVVQSSGYVGIGQPIPAATLHVDGNGMETPTGEVFRTNAPAGATSWRMFSSNVSANEKFNITNPNASNNVSIGTVQSGHLNFFTNNSGTPYVTILGSGNTGFVGMGTTSPEFKLHVSDGGILSTGNTLGSGTPLPSLSGPRLIWYPRKAAFRAGSAGSQWDDGSIGDYSFAAGLETTAEAQASTALGYRTLATEPFTTAMGFKTTASGQGSTAMGEGTSASGRGSTAMGQSTTASGQGSTAMGGGSSAIGSNA